jgi:pyruvate ferredoxin oxidoreductase alpha subunit
VVLVLAGTTASTCRQLVQDLRARGERIGLLKLRRFRPFPVAEVRRHLPASARVAVVDRNNSPGAGGIFAQELRAALCGQSPAPAVHSYVAGLGGRDITTGTLEGIYRRTLAAGAAVAASQWVDVDEELAQS